MMDSAWGRAGVRGAGAGDRSLRALARIVLYTPVMNNYMLTFSMADVSRLRALVAAVGKDIALVQSAGVATEGASAKKALEDSWARLVGMLDLGPEPQLRACPKCNQPCMAGASRCSSCWSSLPALKSKDKAETASAPG